MKSTMKATISIALAALALTGCANIAMDDPAKPDPIYYTVSFDNDGTITTQKVESGQKATKPTDPTKATYAFAGWAYLSAHTSGIEYDFSTPVTEDITLTAKWTKNYHTVTFDANGGDQLFSLRTVAEGDPVQKPDDPTKTGSYFSGWTKDGTAYDFATPVTANLTLTATWSALPVYTVTFDSNGGSAVSSQSVIQGKLASEPSNPTNGVHEFKGWYDGSTKYDFTKAVTSNVALKAKWTTTETTYVYTSTNNGTLGKLTMKAGAFTLQYDDDPLNTDGTFDGSYSGTYSVSNDSYVFEWTVGTAKNATYQASSNKWTRTAGSGTGLGAAFLKGFGTAAVATNSTTVTLETTTIEVE